MVKGRQYFDMLDGSAAEIEWRLGELGTYDPLTLKGNGDCRLTGCCTDEDAIDGFRRAFNGGETDLNALMQVAFRAWLEAAHKDCEAQYADAEFSENSDANEREYYADGRLAP